MTSQRRCFNCGELLSEPPPTDCGHCGQPHYLNPKPCGEAVVIRDGKVLLMLRARAPFEGAWEVPGGFCEGDEHPMHAAERELAEELGVEGQAIAFVGTWIDVYGDPAVDGIRDHTANSAYLVALRDPEAELRPQAEEVREAGWFHLHQLPDRIAFPDHMRSMLRAAAGVSDGSAGPLPDRTW
jgi:ADP-ribose pyrophosphatase YjhB (NUDIX family)